MVVVVVFAVDLMVIIVMVIGGGCCGGRCGCSREESGSCRRVKSLQEIGR
jgi:hypothetical protein